MDGKTRWLRLAATIPAAAMGFMDQTILPVALPTIQKEFHTNGAALQWSVNAYILAMAVFMLIGGKLGDRIGHRKTYLCGMITFAFFSAMCGFSQNIEMLIASRALQGIGAAIMFPSQTTLVAMSFPAHIRGRATGINISFGSLFLILGPLVGGYLTEAFTWHWIFWINIPIALIGIVLSLILLPETQPVRRLIDGWGFIFFSFFAFFTTVLLMQAHDWGWASDRVFSCAVIAILALIFLIKRERVAEHPFLDLTLFKRSAYAAINVSISITQFVMMISVFRIVYIETILGYSPSQAGLISSLSSLPVLFFSSIGGFISDKLSPKLPIVLGFAFLISSFLWFGYHSTPSLHGLFTALLLFGMGIPFILTPSYSTAMSAVPSEKLGVAFGMIATLRMFSGSIGLSFIYFFVSAQQHHYLPMLGQREAIIKSFSGIHYLLGILLILAFLASFFIHRRKSSHHLPPSPAEGWD